MEDQALKTPAEQPKVAGVGEKIADVRKQREDQLKQYGHVLIDVPQFDASGVYLTPRERETERAHVQLHGHASNETATGR